MIICKTGGIMSKIILEEKHIAGIPLLTMAAEGVRAAPLVFYIHGYTADKRQGIRLGMELAGEGYFFAALDASQHGERHDAQMGALLSGEGEYTYPLECGLDIFLHMHRTIVQIGADLDKLMARLGDWPELDVARTGVTGFSMGGFASFYLAATRPWVRTAVPIAGIPTFAARWDDVVLESSSYPVWAAQMAAAEEETAAHYRFMGEIDPAPRLPAFAPRPLLMIQGDMDLDSPKKYAVDMFRTLRPHYKARPEALRLSIHDGVGHQLTNGMIRETAAWFDNHL